MNNLNTSYRKPITLLPLVFKYLLFLALLNVAACGNEKPKTKNELLLQSISELEARFEERKLGRIIEYVSEKYQDDNGRQLKDIKRAIQLQLMRHKTLHVFSRIKDIQWQDEGDEFVNVEIIAAMAGKPIKSASLLKSIRADMVNFRVDFVLEDNLYKVKSATWVWAKPTDFL